MKGRATIPADPEFGVSEHVASLLLAARAAGSDARAVLNVRYDDGVVTALRDAGRTVVEFDAEESVEPAVAAALADDPGADVLYHTGAMGIEPVVYLLGDDAVAVAETARETCDRRAIILRPVAARVRRSSRLRPVWRPGATERWTRWRLHPATPSSRRAGTRVCSLRERVGPSGLSSVST